MHKIHARMYVCMYACVYASMHAAAWMWENTGKTNICGHL